MPCPTCSVRATEDPSLADDITPNAVLPAVRKPATEHAGACSDKQASRFDISSMPGRAAQESHEKVKLVFT